MKRQQQAAREGDDSLGPEARGNPCARGWGIHPL